MGCVYAVERCVDLCPFREYYFGVAIVAIFIYRIYAVLAYISPFSDIPSTNSISTYLDNQAPSGDLKKYHLYTTFFKKGHFVLGVFVVVGMMISLPAFAHAGIIGDFLQSLIKKGDAAPQESSSASISMPLMGSQSTQPPIQSVGGADQIIDDTPLPVVQDSALVATRNPQGTMSPNRDQIVIYTVQDGDTPSGIAKNFGISLNTLLWANNITNANRIKPGDDLVILPVSGVEYTVKKGDTLGSIAKKFNGDVSDIVSFNDLTDGESLVVGSTLIIPDGEMNIASSPSPASTKPYASRFSSLPNFVGYYLRPIFGGRKTQGIHGFNGVDLAESCGLPVVASAEGNVILARSTGWNGGYGKYIVIAHSNGTQTLYAHLSSIFINAGEHVEQGVQIGNVGSTGNSTGCHVHFEVRGAKNPF